MDEHLRRLKTVLGSFKKLVEFDLRLLNFYGFRELTNLEPLAALGNFEQLQTLNLNLYNCDDIRTPGFIDVFASLQRLPHFKELGLTLGKVLGIDDGGNLVNLLALTLPRLASLEHLSLTLHCFHDINLDAWCNLLTSLKNMPNLTRLTLRLECEPDMWNAKGLDRLFSFMQTLCAICDFSFIDKFTKLKIVLSSIPKEEDIDSADASEVSAISSQAIGALHDEGPITEENVSEDAISEENSGGVIAENETAGANPTVNEIIASISEEEIAGDIEENEAARGVVESGLANNIKDKYRELDDLTNKLIFASQTNPKLELILN
jgi:hypothetical protein